MVERALVVDVDRLEDIDRLEDDVLGVVLAMELRKRRKMTDESQCEARISFRMLSFSFADGKEEQSRAKG